MEKINELLPREKKIPWDEIEKTQAGLFLDQMKKTPQNPEYHREGSVFEHTKLVCEKLLSLKEYEESTEYEKKLLFLSCLFHDVGKIRCTKMQDGVITSSGHSLIGALMTREFLWRDMGLCGSKEKRDLREGVCSLIRYHSFPPYAVNSKNLPLKLLKIASDGELIKDFSLKLLYILEKADILGRISKDGEEYLEKNELFKVSAEENGCFHKPFEFSSEYTQRAFFKGQTRWKEDNLFNSCEGEVILLCGLPGTGKDYWIEKNTKGLPVISLDEIRKELKISPTDNQGKVIARAHETAREFLRKRMGFVWNATNVTPLTRAKQIDLFEGYNFDVKTVFLETEWKEQLRRNDSRKNKVPKNVIEKLLSKTELPERFESQKVVWETT